MAKIPYLGTALTNLFRKPVTIAFPAGEAPKAQPNYRGRIAFDGTKCVNCGMCERVCAPSCMTSCTFCGMCADFCAKKAITLTDDYMMTGTQAEDFLVVGKVIKKAPPKPKFTPEQLAAMKAAAEAKKKAAEAAKAAAEGK